MKQKTEEGTRSANLRRLMSIIRASRSLWISELSEDLTQSYTGNSVVTHHFKVRSDFRKITKMEEKITI
jgi:hypothetical protein